MGRAPRMECKGAVYHVIQRGNNREHILQHQEDKSYLMHWVREYKREFNFQLFGFVLMNNHVHLVIRTLGEPLQMIMHRLCNRYSKYYNAKYDRTGHVFENRYRSLWVQDERYLFSLLRYVHQNPVRAGLCPEAKDYRWSSDPYYRTNQSAELVDIDFIQSVFAGPNSTSQEKTGRYSLFMDAATMESDAIFENTSLIGEENGLDHPIGQSRGGEKSIEKSREETHAAHALESSLIMGEVPAETAKPVLLDQILSQTAGNCLETMGLIKEGSRKRGLKPVKQAFIQQAVQQGHAQRSIAAYLGISPVAVHHLLKNK